MDLKWIEHKGRKILLIDYTAIKMEKDMVAHLQKALPMINDLPIGENLYVVSDLTGCFTTPGFIDAAKKLEKELAPKYKLKWAILGITGAKVVLLKGFNLVAKVKVEPFNRMEDALEYLSK